MYRYLPSLSKRGILLGAQSRSRFIVRLSWVSPTIFAKLMFIFCLFVNAKRNWEVGTPKTSDMAKTHILRSTALYLLRVSFTKRFKFEYQLISKLCLRGYFKVLWRMKKVSIPILTLKSDIQRREPRRENADL